MASAALAVDWAGPADRRGAGSGRGGFGMVDQPINHHFRFYALIGKREDLWQQWRVNSHEGHPQRRQFLGGFRLPMKHVFASFGSRGLYCCANATRMEPGLGDMPSSQRRALAGALEF